MSVFEHNILRLPKPNYKYITKEDGARVALNEISKYNILEVDSETTGLDPYTSKASLLQIGIPNKAFVFDVRNDTEHSNIGWELFKPVLTDKNVLKILQNAVFDMKVIKVQGGYYIENIYDTMLVEQMFYLGLHGYKADLATLIFKYLGITVDKEPRSTFSDYNQTFQPFQLEYAANDVLVLDTIRNMQIPRIVKEGFENVCRLEFEFTKPMCEMELNGICFDVDKQRIILGDVEKERDKHGNIVREMFAEAEDQTTLFGVSLINIDSNVQLLKALNKSGFELESTDVKILKKYAGMPIIDELLAYRKAQKFISTYGETLIAKINPVTGRLHTRFRQMVSTGRMSSSEPNLQNIPKKQIYRSCFVTKPGYVLVTCDMSGAELRIMGNLSADKLFVECYATGQDLHTRTASEVFGIKIEKVLGKHRNSAKAINFGLCVSDDTDIITDSGVKKIQHIKTGDIISHDVGTNKVISAAYMGKKEVFEIKTQYGYTLEVTSKHLVKVIDKQGKYTDKKLESIDIDNDYVCLRAATNFFPNCDFVFDDFTIEKRTNYKHFDLPKKIDNKWAEFLGLFVSEGSITKTKGRSNYSGLQFGFSDKEPEFIKKIDNLLYSLFDDKLYRIHKNGVVKYSFNSVLFCEWLVNICNIKEVDKTGEICIPDCIKQSSRKIQIYFLNWLFEGDGSVKQNGNGYAITYSSKSYGLVKDVQLMLLNFGVLSSIRDETRMDYPGEIYYELRLVSDKGRSVFVGDIGFVTEHKNNKCVNNSSRKESVYFLPNQVNRLNMILSLRTKQERETRELYDIIYNAKNLTQGVGNIYFEKLSKHDNFIKFIYENNIIPLPIKSIKSKGMKKVYDLSIEKHHYFLANGFVVHNCYGLSKYGLARNLSISEKEADNMINTYFERYSGIKRLLDDAGKNAVRKRYSKTVSGRKRFYNLPEYGHADFKRIKRSIEREGKNAIIQGANADTIKESMIYVVDRLEESEYDAKLLLTVHDEVVIEVREDQKYEVAEIVSQCLIDGFAKYFSLIPMEADALIGQCWLKSECENEVSPDKKCGGKEMIFVEDKKYGTKIVCKKCGAEQ
jgi:DNA polymerase I-like protein with 3'-5' exonuclease and polymerase domains/intein/homing endonuclease